MSDSRPGYSDTPQLPDAEYCVHDPERPHPPTIAPGEPPATSGTPPADAVRLLDDDGLHGWEHDNGDDAQWDVADGVVTVEPGSGDIRTRTAIGDCQLHVEWATPAEASGEGQGRGNSGVFLMDRYEIQVLDTYENPTYADGFAGAVYGQQPPEVNASRPPGEWQQYDILWRGPRFDGDDVSRPATVTVLHNGVLVQHDTEINGPTTHRDVTDYAAHPPEAPLRLQDHGDRVRFRNIWYRSLD